MQFKVELTPEAKNRISWIQDYLKKADHFININDPEADLYLEIIGLLIQALPKCDAVNPQREQYKLLRTRNAVNQAEVLFQQYERSLKKKEFKEVINVLMELEKNLDAYKIFKDRKRILKEAFQKAHPLISSLDARVQQAKERFVDVLLECIEQDTDEPEPYLYLDRIGENFSLLRKFMRHLRVVTPEQQIKMDVLQKQFDEQRRNYLSECRDSLKEFLKRTKACSNVLERQKRLKPLRHILGALTEEEAIALKVDGLKGKYKQLHRAVGYAVKSNSMFSQNYVCPKSLERLILDDFRKITSDFPAIKIVAPLAKIDINLNLHPSPHGIVLQEHYNLIHGLFRNFHDIQGGIDEMREQLHLWDMNVPSSASKPNDEVLVASINNALQMKKMCSDVVTGHRVFRAHFQKQIGELDEIIFQLTHRIDLILFMQKMEEYIPYYEALFQRARIFFEEAMESLNKKQNLLYCKEQLNQLDSFEKNIPVYQLFLAAKGMELPRLQHLEIIIPRLRNQCNEAIRALNGSYDSLEGERRYRFHSVAVSAMESDSKQSASHPIVVKK